PRRRDFPRPNGRLVRPGSCYLVPAVFWLWRLFEDSLPPLVTHIKTCISRGPFRRNSGGIRELRNLQAGGTSSPCLWKRLPWGFHSLSIKIAKPEASVAR
uniref:Glycoprotein integral membrane 1 n=2 Tax=Mus musculus TaxID=10090 RepID=F7AHX3_MOUSE